MNINFYLIIIKVDLNNNTAKTYFFGNSHIKKSNEIMIRISDLGDETKFNKEENEKQIAFTSRSLRDTKNRVII